MARWNPADHPRYPNGRFRPKFSQSVRLSPRSVSYNAGARVPIVPGRAQLYVGALIRVERVQGGKFGQSIINRGVNKVAGMFGDKGGVSPVSRLLKGEDLQVGNYRVGATGLRPQAPTFRLSSTPASRENAKVVERKASSDRSPRRRPRTRSTARSGVRPSTITSGITTMPPTVKKPRRTRKAVTSGRKVKRR